MAYLLRHFRSSDQSSIQMIADEALGKGSAIPSLLIVLARERQAASCRDYPRGCQLLATEGRARLPTVRVAGDHS